MSYAGDQNPSCSPSSEEGSQSQLFFFRFGEADIIKQYVVSLPDSPRQQNTLSCVNLEETCNLYLHQRLHYFCLYAGSYNLNVWCAILF